MKYDYQKICSNFLKGLPQRTANVIERRFGLKSGTGKKETLEAIGESYNITRERIRQIEEEGFSKIRPKIKDYQKVFQYFNNTLASSGDFKEEDTLLKFLGGEKYQNHAFFLLTLQPLTKSGRLTNGEGFERLSEDKDFYPLWTIKKESANLAKKAVKSTINKMEKGKRVLTLDELFKSQKKELIKFLGERLNKSIFLSCLEISKKIQRNPESQFGLRDWLEINPRGIKDRAYLVLKKEEKPLHFAEVATFIEKLPFPFQRKTHTATVHNELIKDPRFVLVGRGLYALKEWGYTPGVVRDIITKVLKDSKKPLSKKEILKNVLEQRFVKENTVALNLQNRNHFLRDSKGKYTIREA